MSSLVHAAAPGGQADAREHRRARFAHAVERGGDAALGRDHVGPALEQFRRHADRRGRGHRREPIGDGDLRPRIAPHEELQRAQGLLARQLDLAQPVAVGAGARARLRHRLLVAVADAQPVLRDAQQRVRGAHRLLRNRALQPGLDREEPALGDRGRQRLARVRVVGGERRGLFLRRRTPVAQAAPDVELQRRIEPDPLEAAATARIYPGDARDAHRRPQRAARHLHVTGGLLDARRRHLQVGVEGQGFRDERSQCGIVERHEPRVRHRRRRAHRSPSMPSAPPYAAAPASAARPSSAAG